MSRKRRSSTHLAIGLIAALCCLAAFRSVPAHAQDGAFGQFLRSLFGPAARKLDLIDRHAAAASRELTRSLEQCDSMIAARQWDQAVRQLQYLIDLPEDALVLNGARWVSIKRRAEEKLVALPEEGRRFYLNLYEETARDQLARARAKGDFEAICRVASRFRITEAGESAADEVAALLADAGDFIASAQWALELERDRSPVTSTPGWKSRTATVLRELEPAESARRLDPASAPETSRAPRDLPATPSAEWTEVYGGPARLNSVAGDRPLLLEEWAAPATEIPQFQEDIEQRQEDLFAGSHRPLPVSNVVASHGLMAVRTVGGLEVREVASGRLRWKTRGRNTVESLLLREAGENGVPALTLGPADNHEGHPLSSFFYRDAVLGQLSTDGRRLFAIGRKSALLSSAYDVGMVTDDEGGEDRGFNTIVALDFESGRTLWTTGGSNQDAPFESPLAGVYFFGPPAVDGGELFAIGVAGADVNLYCLEASTGLPKWKQFIAQYDTPKINDDFVRQMWSCTPLVTRGLIYCPTNAGWLVAVDRHRRRLAWATRYATGEVSDRFQPQYTLAALNDRWAQTAPLLSGGELVFAPPELPDEPMQTDPHLYRIDAVTGRVMFRRGKGDSLAVGGLYGETVLVLGRQGLEGWPPLPKWSSRWSTPYPEGFTPCGTGVAIGGIYWMPFREGAVVGFRLSDGVIEDILRNEALAGRLGNLIVNRDRVVSAGPTGIVALWQKGPFEKQLVEQLAKNPGDLEARLRKARGLFSNQKFEETLQELESADPGSSGSPELASAARELRWKSLRALLSRSTAGDDPRWTRLEELADSPEEKQAVSRMQIDRSIAQGRWQDALDRCWRMTDSADELVEDDGLQIGGDLWASGRLDDLWTKAPPEIRTDLTNRIGERTRLEGPRLAREGSRAERLFGFHPLGRRLSLQLGLADADEGNLALAETRLLPLAKAIETDLAAAAVTKLAELSAEKGNWYDAARLVATARRLDPQTTLPGGVTLKAWLERQTAQPAETQARPPMSGWNLKQGEIIRLGAEREFELGRPIWVHGRPSRWMNDKRLEFSGSWYGLSVLDRATNRSEWTMPLAANGVAFEEWTPEATAGGNLLAISSRGMLHVCSPVDRSMLWSWPLPPRFSTPTSYGWAEEQLANQAVRTIATAVNEFQANVGSLREGPLMAFAGDAFALLGQRELIVFDVRTGEELWRRDGMSGAAVLVLDEETVSVSATSSGEPAAYRIRDGRRHDPGTLAGVFKRAFAVEGDFVLTRQELPLLPGQIRIAAERPSSGAVVWSQAVTSGVSIHRLPGAELAGIEPSGEVFVIDVETGARTNLGSLAGVAAGPRGEMHVLADADRLYVAVHRAQSYEFSHVAIPSVSLNGELYAFDRRERRLAWSEKIREASMLTARFADSPVVILAEHGVPPRRRKLLDALNLPQLKLAVLDKRTGARVAEWNGVTQHGSPAALTLDPSRQRIDLFLNHYSHNFSDRLRLQFGTPTPPVVR